MARHIGRKGASVYMDELNMLEVQFIRHIYYIYIYIYQIYK